MIHRSIMYMLQIENSCESLYFDLKSFFLLLMSVTVSVNKTDRVSDLPDQHVLDLNDNRGVYCHIQESTDLLSM